MYKNNTSVLIQEKRVARLNLFWTVSWANVMNEQ